MMLSLIIMLFAFIPAHARTVIPQAKPYKVEMAEIKHFLSTKNNFISYGRIYSDARPMLSIMSVENNIDFEFDSDFYDCLSENATQVLSALKTLDPVSKKNIKNVFIGIRQFDNAFLDTLCVSNSGFSAPGTFYVLTCHSSRKTPSDKPVCKSSTVADLAASMKYSTASEENRVKSFNKLQNISKELIDVIAN